MKNYWLQQAKKKRIKICNSRFLEEARQLEGRWQSTGLLEQIPDRYKRDTTAVLLESQRLCNEINKEKKS